MSPARETGSPTVRLRPWQRLSVRLAALFAAVTVLAVALVGGVVYERQKREVEGTVGTQLLNIARVAALLVDPTAHAEVERTHATTSPVYVRLQKALAAVRTETLLPRPVYTLTDFNAARREARLGVTSGGLGVHWSRRKGSGSAGKSAWSPSSCPTSAATPGSPSKAIPPGSWRSSTVTWRG